MGSLPYAFSVHHFINSVGSDAGFASIIGLAILILLYFAHARETASLREQLYEWAQRAQQLEARVTQLSKQLTAVSSPSAPQVTPAPASRAVPGQAAGSSTVATAAPMAARAMAGAPAGVAAPALTAATKLIPTGEDVASAGGGGVAAPPIEAPVDDTAIASPPPVTVAGGANGASYEHLETQPASTALGAPPPPPPPIQIRPGATAPGRRPPAPPRGQPTRGAPPSRSRRGLIVVLAAVVVAAIIGGLLLATSGSGSKPKSASSTTAGRNTAATRHRAKPTQVVPSSVTVAVLNGTPTTGLAGRVSQKLVADGYKPGKIATAADQTRTATVVEYMPGERRQALAVASSLKLGPASVQAVDASNQAVACPPPAACTANVIAVLGTDLANTQ